MTMTMTMRMKLKTKNTGEEWSATGDGGRGP
jgi:hypothetical protein